MAEDHMDSQGLSDSLSKTVNPNSSAIFNAAFDKTDVNTNW
jgi:hypothetical protein